MIKQLKAMISEHDLQANELNEAFTEFAFQRQNSIGIGETTKKHRDLSSKLANRLKEICPPDEYLALDALRVEVEAEVADVYYRAGVVDGISIVASVVND
ncbi:hypothetical protein [Desulfitibacter alkalitolerans]|uniref:hypothetical protein n=1 Tax=Desulfitibacter alkalitolerans TaxID=264641 RepID=UPI000482E558|nr:hypothetical protein [Desulfitibacter alkalitolerans]